jgi:glycosyltransferase involved in cell wall biosynthesis
VLVFFYEIFRFRNTQIEYKHSARRPSETASNMSNSFNVFMIGWEYPPHNSGGLGVACQGITEALAERNHKLYFTLPYAIKSSPAHMTVMACRDPDWESPVTQPPFLAYSSLSDMVSATLDDSNSQVAAHDLATLPSSEIELKVSQYADLVANEAKKHKNKFDVIHAHDWMSFPAAMRVKNIANKPLVTHIHSTELDRIPSGNGSPYITHIEKVGMDASDVIVAVSNYTKRLLVQKYGVPDSKIRVVHNGMFFSDSMNPGNHHFAPDRPIIVFMGRLTAQKGPEYFVRLARHVIKDLPDALFVVAGHGDMYHRLLLQTAHEGLSAKVLFSGFVRHTQRETLLDRANVFIMPSLSEPFGLVALEAAERDTPVIVSKNAGVSEVLPSALTIDFWDLDAMSSAVVRLVKDPEYSRKVVQQHHKELQQVTWQAAAEKLENVYKQTMIGIKKN